jgi:oxalate decarboxylase/phosphoglucose isomerase-like protein (cupin superfamily)
MPKNNNTVFDCSLLELDKHHHKKGNISVVENMNEVPFEIQRIYYLYDIPGGEGRGAHAHKKLHQFLIAASGSFDIILDDSKVKRSITLNRPYIGLLITPGIWRELVNFSSGAICMVLASELYDKEDYIRNYPEFLKFKNNE